MSRTIQPRDVRADDNTIVECYNRFAAELRDALRVIEGHPFFGARIIKDVAVGTTDTRVYHGLGRTYRGWTKIKDTVGVSVYDGSDPTDKSQYLNLVAASAVTIDLVVF